MNQHATTRGDEPLEPTFDATVDSSTLGDALAAVQALVDECVVRVSPEGLAVDAQDPATVAMVSLDLPASAFASYDAGETTMGVDLDRLSDVVGMADGDEPVRMRLDAETRTLHLRVGELSYTLGLMDPDAIRSPPDASGFPELPASITLHGQDLVQAVRAADMVSEPLALGADGRPPLRQRRRRHRHRHRRRHRLRGGRVPRRGVRVVRRRRRPRTVLGVVPRLRRPRRARGRVRRRSTRRGDAAGPDVRPGRRVRPVRRRPADQSVVTDPVRAPWEAGAGRRR
ncbi:hypothetical protein BRC81_10400 [Halobacteriales archaeon QS_1_68_20]|nr:MAG: hypothetical protein BRC81_10400 [Halobacteriales archaeon QS_1_68_20]